MPQVKYRTKDGLADYLFSFEQQSDGSWRAYILDMPSYGSRSTSGTVTHRLYDGRHYVCFTPPPRTLVDMQKVAAYWADLTQTYLRTGRTIDEQVREDQSKR